MKNKKSMISIIMPFFKKEKFFFKAYESALNQSYKNFEIIIVCDDTSKSSRATLKKVEHIPKTRIIYNKKNYGVSYSRNIGIKNSIGNYIAFLDCDDVWKKKKLEIQIKWMKKNKLDFSHTSYFIINENDKKIGSQIAKKTLKYNELIKCCYIGTSSVICKKKLIEKNLFQNISTQEDYISWLNISRNMDIQGLKNKLSMWRKNKNSLSNDLPTKLLNAFLVYYKLSLIHI